MTSRRKFAALLLSAVPVAWADCLTAEEIPPAYVMKPGDMVELRFFMNPELNDQVQIRPDGRVTLQLVGEFTLAGQTISEATKSVEKLYAAELRFPRLTIQVRQFANQKVFVTGEVLRPGPLSMPGQMTLLEALGEAGGINTKTGSQDLVVLVRKGPDGAPVGKKLKPLSKGMPTADAAVVLQPFDVILVPESKIARLDRWVDQHIRQLIPIGTNAGFAYVVQRQGGGGVIPIF